VEVGHRYVMAMRWEEARCSADGEQTASQWRGLGEGSEIPYDDDTLGRGESERLFTPPPGSDEGLCPDCRALGRRGSTHPPAEGAGYAEFLTARQAKPSARRRAG
jgi:hypothetical protein